MVSLLGWRHFVASILMVGGIITALLELCPSVAARAVSPLTVGGGVAAIIGLLIGFKPAAGEPSMPPHE